MLFLKKYTCLLLSTDLKQGGTQQRESENHEGSDWTNSLRICIL